MVDKLVTYGAHVCWLVLAGVLLVSCATEPKEPNVLIEDQIVNYQPTEGEIVGVTSNRLWIVKESFIRKALNDADRINELEGRLREAEIKP